MDHTERIELSEWVRRSMALLEPPAEWEPNEKRAQLRVEDRLERPSRPGLRRALMASIATVSIACLLLAVIPLTRVAAEQAGIGWYRVDQLWYWLTLSRSWQLVRVAQLPADVKSLGSQMLAEHNSWQRVADVREAAQRAGFVPQLPDSGLLAGGQHTSVSGPVSFGTAFRASDLAAALTRAHVTDQTVPGAWDGARIGVQIGNRINTEWPGVTGWSRLTVTESTVPVFLLPAGADLTSFAALYMRAAGRSRERAVELAQFAEPTALLLAGDGVPNASAASNAVVARVVSLRSGPGLVIEEWSNLGHSELEVGPPIRRISLLWKAQNRVLVLSGELSVPLGLPSYDLAGVIATMTGLANTIR